MSLYRIYLCGTETILSFIQGLFVSGVITYSSLKYERKSVTYAFPPWAIMIGWIMAAASITWIPINMVYKICNSRGSLMQVRGSYKNGINLAEHVS